MNIEPKVGDAVRLTGRPFFLHHHYYLDPFNLNAGDMGMIKEIDLNYGWAYITWDILYPGATFPASLLSLLAVPRNNGVLKTVRERFSPDAPLSEINLWEWKGIAEPPPPTHRGHSVSHWDFVEKQPYFAPSLSWEKIRSTLEPIGFQVDQSTHTIKSKEGDYKTWAIDRMEGWKGCYVDRDTGYDYNQKIFGGRHKGLADAINHYLNK